MGCLRWPTFVCLTLTSGPAGLSRAAALKHAPPPPPPPPFPPPHQGAFGSNYRGSGSLLPLLYVLSKTLIRHTKQQNLGGQEVLQLPPKTETAVPGALRCAPARVRAEHVMAAVCGLPLLRAALALAVCTSVHPRPALEWVV